MKALRIETSFAEKKPGYFAVWNFFTIIYQKSAFLKRPPTKRAVSALGMR